MIAREDDGYRLQTTQYFAQSPEEIFPFFADAGNLQRITPSWLNFEILPPQPVAMFAGAGIRYRIRLLGLPMRWATRIKKWQPPWCFVDDQEQGPYRCWIHEHRFDAHEDGGTLMTDTVHMRSRGPRWLVPLIHHAFVNPRVKAIFDFRRARLEQIFSHDSGSSPPGWVGSGKPEAT